MKKILIGCGILVLLVIAGLGVMAYMFGGDIMQMTGEMALQAKRMTDVGDEHPFTEPTTPEAFEAERFLTSLDVRESLLTNLEAIGQQFEALEDEELGFMDTMKQTMAAGMAASSGVYEGMADGLEAARMGPDEFVFHTKVLWASLKSVDAGLGPESLAPYRNVFTMANTETAEQFRFQPNTPDSLEAFADGVSPGIVEKAVSVLGDNVDKLQQALPADRATDLAQGVDVLTTTLPKWLKDMQPMIQQIESGELTVDQ